MFKIFPRSLPLRALALLCAGALTAPAPALAQTIETPAKHAFLIDMDTDTVLLDKLADVPMPPASMSKLMTIYMVFDSLKADRLSLDDKFLVSRKAWRMGGSKMFVMVNTRVTVRDLLRGIIVQSGNDACIVVAEGLAGSEDAFARKMTAKAREIGLTNSSFKNATGWPAEGHVMSARDIATLSARLIRDFPDYYPMFAELNFTYGGIKQGNRNPLLYKKFGADGLKTGHTEASGYGLAASAVRDGRRLLLVLNGLGSMRQRSSESARLLDWGFRETKTYQLFGKDEEIATADIWLGRAASVPLVLGGPLKLTMSRKARQGMVVKLNYRGPIPAPVAKGAPLGRLIVSQPGRPPLEVPVLAGQTVQQLGVFGRLSAALQYLLWGAAGSS